MSADHDRPSGLPGKRSQLAFPGPEHPSEETAAPDDLLTRRAVHLVDTWLESAMWYTAEALSAQAGPVGPMVVRLACLSRQLYIAARGLDNGAGFQFKISVPGLDLLPGAPVPDGWELVTRVRLGATARPASEAGVRSEIQIFQPWLHQVDVAAADRPPALGVPPAASEPPPGADPWAAWIALLGPAVMRDVSRALSVAVGRPVGDVRRADGPLEHGSRAAPDC